MPDSASITPIEYLTDDDHLAMAETAAALSAGMPGLGLWRIRSDGFVWWSPGEYAHFGLDPAAGVPRPADLFGMYHPDDANLVAKALRDCFKTAVPGSFRYRVVRPDGQIRHLSSQHMRLPPDAQGRRVVVGVDVDVTGRDEEFERLQESERLFRFVAENTRDVIVRCRSNGQITYLSRACKTVTGFEPEELIGTRSVDLLHPDDKGRLLADNHALLASGQTMAQMPCEYRLRHKDGHWVWLESHPRLVRNGAGEIVEQIDVVRDVTVRRLAEDEAAAARAQAQAAVLAKSEFLANMSHELRTPLTSIVGFSRLIGSGGGLSAADQRHLELVRSASETLLALVGDILDFSRLEAGAVKLSPNPFRVGDLVEGAAALMQEQARSKGLSLSTRVDGDACVLGDAARLRQVLFNLLGNAIKFTEAGSITVEADCTPEDAGLRLSLSVRDTGVGVPAEQQDGIFERFSQADNSISRRFGGAGLGLAISRRLMEVMGGDIGVESDGRTGSHFWVAVTLPRAEHTDAECAVEADQPPLSPIRVLLAEDNPANRLLVSTLLEQFDLTLDVVEDGLEALRAATATVYDLVLMDMQMPVMDGLTACRRIKALAGDHGSVPILALSANVLPEQVEQCLAVGMVGHLAKPIDAGELFSAIATHARQSTRAAPASQVVTRGDERRAA